MAAETEQASTAATPAQRRPRAVRTGVVTSDARDKTIRVTIGFSVRHAKYGKTLRRRTVLHVHDEQNEASVGDTVEIAECRPLSKTKNWRLVRVLRKGTGGGEA
jgi:small subunit ribosomal protein S17